MKSTLQSRESPLYGPATIAEQMTAGKSVSCDLHQPIKSQQAFTPHLQASVGNWAENFTMTTTSSLCFLGVTFGL